MIHYTTIEQSKKLLKLGLSTASADMKWRNGNVDNLIHYTVPFPLEEFEFCDLEKDVPSWSLGALLEVMPKIPRVEFNLVLPGASEEPPYIAFDDCRENHQVHLNFEGETPLEAAYNTVCWLLENGYIKPEL